MARIDHYRAILAKRYAPTRAVEKQYHFVLLDPSHRQIGNVQVMSQEQADRINATLSSGNEWVRLAP
jgi:hypothetical protein